MTTPYVVYGMTGDLNHPNTRENPKSNTYISLGNTKVYFEGAPLWKEKGTYCQKAGSSHDLIDGTNVQQVFSTDLTGKPITLELSKEKGGIISASRMASLVTLMNSTSSNVPCYFSDDNGTTSYACIFDYSKDRPVDLQPIDQNNVFYVGTIFLIMV
jgi:hypothetical protein